MAAVQRKLVHKQFNSPIGLYSQQNVKETLNRELQAFGNEGIEIDEQISKPLNLANSAVLRAVEEEEQMKCEPLKKCIRESRSRQRFQQRPHTPVHQQQLEQIKTQYLSHQNDITIDRDTVLKINRLATRRNLHKRDHSWPPITVTATNTATGLNEQQQLKNVDDVKNVVQHVRSTSNDNALQFDKTVCKRHGIDVIREKFNSPTRIIEPTAQELRQRRQQQQWRSSSGSGKHVEGLGIENCCVVNKAKEMINLAKHEELLKQKNMQGKSKTIIPEKSVKISTEDTEKTVTSKVKEPEDQELYQPNNVPVAKGFSHPETKAADENIGLVEPKRQFYEQLAGGKKWYSYENLLAAVNTYPSIKPIAQASHKRQAYSLERGRDKRMCKQLPPQKPRGTPKLQRRSMKLATEIKICYDTDAQQDNFQVKSLNQPNKHTAEDLEHIPLPAIPDKSKTNTIKDQSFYDDSCIFLRSVDLEDNTVAYIPAAITIVPSPTEEIMQHWLESNNLKANIKDLTKSVNKEKQQMCDNAVLVAKGQQKNDQQLNVESKTSPTRATIATTAKFVTPSTNTKQMSKTIPQEVTSATEGDKPKEKDMYYTDGEYVYGPCDPNTGKPLPNAIIRSVEAAQQEQKKQKLPQIKKVAEAETKTHQQQNKNEIANLTAKYEHIQKSINEHLKQIDAYIENAKTALKSTFANSLGNMSASTNLPQIKIDQSLASTRNDLELQQQQQQQPEKPLKEILRQITNIMQEVKPLSRHTTNQKETHTRMAPKTKGGEGNQNEAAGENMPVVDKVLMDLNLLTNHLTELNKSSIDGSAVAAVAATTELKPIIEQLQKQATSLDLQYGNQHLPIACQPAYIAVEDMAKGNKEIPLNKAKGQATITPTAPAPPPPPPPPPPLPLSSPTTKQEKCWAEKQLLATDKKLITVQKQTPIASTKSLPATSPYCDDKKKIFKVTATPRDDDDDGEAKEKKNFVFDFVTERQQQENLVEQVIDTLGKLENKSKENLVNTHVQPTATPTTAPTATKQDTDDEQPEIKSNLNQQTPSPSASVADTLSVTASSAVKDVLVSLQKCNVNNLANAFGKVACNHDNDLKKPSKGNESQLKLYIEDFADKIADKQFQKYDNQLLTKNNNDVVIANNTTKPSQQLSNKQVCPHQEDDTAADADADKVNDNKIKANKKSQPTKTEQKSQEREKVLTEVEEGDSNHSSGSELSNTYKSSYELPSPYITERQITWQDVKQITTPITTTTTATVTATTTATLIHDQSPTPSESKEATTMLNNIQRKLKHDMQIVQKSTKTQDGLCEISPTTSLAMTKTTATIAATKTMKTTSGHVEMQSMTSSKPRIQTRKQQPQQQHHYHHQQQSLKTLHAHIPLNDMDTTATLKQRGRSDIRKYPSPLAEPHLPTRATTPFDLNALEMKNAKRSKSNSPKPFNDNKSLTSARKYPARLIEPHMPRRSVSPFGFNSAEKAENVHTIETLPLEDNDEQEKENRLDSPIRKYPPALIEPHVPTRAISPFGLNAVLTATPTPASTSTRGQQHHYHHAQQTLQTTVVYVPQVEGHNIGLLVRASTPQPYNSYQANVNQKAAPTFSEIITAAKTLQDYATMTATLRDVTGNKNATTNVRDNRDDDDEATCDELQRINTIGLNKQGTTATATTTADISLQRQQTREQMQVSFEQCSDSQTSVMPTDTTTIPLSASIINRSYDNVSPRPYITIEGYKRVAWPPASEERVVREFTPQPQTQYQPVPAYNQQQQYQPQPQQQPTAAPTQGLINNNVPQHHAPNNTNHIARDNNSPPCMTNPNQIQYEAFPPQTPETPIILKDKQFSRPPSQEPYQINCLPYQQQPYQNQQSQNQPIQQYAPQQQQQQQHQHYQQPQYQHQQQQQPPLTNQPLYQQQYESSQQQQPPQHQYAPAGWKPIRPPQSKQEHLFTNPLGVRETTCSIAAPVYQQQYQNYHQQPQQQYQQQQYRAPSYDSYQQQPHASQQQYPPQAQYQAQAPLAQNQYQQPHQSVSHFQQQQPPSQQQYKPQPAWSQQQQQQPQQQQYQQPPWMQQQQPQQYQQQSQYQNSLNQSNQAPSHYQQPPQSQQQQQQQQYNNQFVSQNNQQQFNSYSQPQQQQHTVSHDQVDQQAHLSQDQRGTSPGIMTLRKEAPITQKPAPVYTSQPAAVSFRGGSSMRGDLKWPPPEYKEAAAKENEERRQLALGPVCRPRKVHRDYTSFFAKNALSHHYPSYKVPPGTQHMIN